MTLARRILISSVAGTALTAVLAAVFLIVAGAFPNAAPSLKKIAAVAFWPVAAGMGLTQSGPNLGTPQAPVYRLTAARLTALTSGIALTWIFYCGIVFAGVSLHSRKARAE